MQLSCPVKLVVLIWRKTQHGCSTENAINSLWLLANGLASKRMLNITHAIYVASVWFGSKTTQVGAAGIWWPTDVLLPICVHKKNEKLLMWNQNFFFVHKSVPDIFRFLLALGKYTFHSFSYFIWLFVVFLHSNVFQFYFIVSVRVIFNINMTAVGREIGSAGKYSSCPL